MSRLITSALTRVLAIWLVPAHWLAVALQRRSPEAHRTAQITDGLGMAKYQCGRLIELRQGYYGED